MTTPPRKRGRPPVAPENRRVLVALRLPPDAAERLKQLAAARDQSQGDLVASLLARAK